VVQVFFGGWPNFLKWPKKNNSVKKEAKDDKVFDEQPKRLSEKTVDVTIECR